MTEPGEDRNPWVLWLANSWIAGIWGACFGLIAILSSRLVAGIHFQDVFWDGDVGQAVVVLVILLVLTGLSGALLTTQHFRSTEPFRLRFGISISILIFCAFGYLGVILILVTFLEIELNDHVFFAAMIIGVTPSPFIVRDLSERFLGRRHAAD